MTNTNPMTNNPHTYPPGRWQVGDHAITTYGNRVKIIAPPDGDLVMVRYAMTGREANAHTYDLRRETFWEFITRPSGFGKTRWWSFIIRMVFIVVLCVYGAVTWHDGGIWAVVFAVLIFAWMMIGTVGNYKGWMR